MKCKNDTKNLKNNSFAIPRLVLQIKEHLKAAVLNMLKKHKKY